MPVILKIGELEHGPVHLGGQVSLEDLGIVLNDELIRSALPLEYDLVAEDTADGLLIRGVIGVCLNCDCARCLRPFVHRLELTDWTCHLSREEITSGGREGFADLTPHFREDILLELPQRPVCGSGCVGLLQQAEAKNAPNDAGQGDPGRSPDPWAALSKLKF
jgi:uncharacterized metal-binding protein YceD (DUF177 family)